MSLQTNLLRPTAWLAFFALVILSWLYLYLMATGMGMTLTGSMRMDTGQMGMGQMDMGQMDMSMTRLSLLAPMWIIMMAAMMGPTFVPTLRTYEDLIGSGAGSRAGFLGLVAGYLSVWFVFGFLIALAHAGFLRLGLLNSMGASASALFSAVLLALAGAYQFTPFKDRCLAYCRSPFTMMMARWKGGFAGGANMGARIGGYCVACCWLIMAIGFVGGAMNLVWMGIATLIMTVEKLPELGKWLTRPLGIAFLAASGWQASLAI